MVNPSYISSHYVKVLLDRAQLRGLNQTKLINKANIDSEKIAETGANGAEGRIEPFKVSKLIRLMWAEMNDEFLGFTSTPCNLGTFRLFAEQAVYCTSIYDVLGLAARFYSTIRHDIDLALREEKSEIILSLAIDNGELDADNFLVEFMMLCLHRFCCWLCKDNLPLNSVSTAFCSPDHSSEYQYLFSTEIEFNTLENSLRFPDSVKKLAVKQGAKDIEVYLANSPIKILSRPLFSSKYSNEIVNYLNSGHEIEKNTLSDIANCLQLSERHLRRKLESEGVTFQFIKNEIRKEKAINLLTDSQLSIAEVGFVLGFTEPSAFSRAFRLWTGLTPRMYRSKF